VLTHAILERFRYERYTNKAYFILLDFTSKLKQLSLEVALIAMATVFLL